MKLYFFKLLSTLSVLAALSGCADKLHPNTIRSYELGFGSVKRMQDYFAYQLGKRPILSAHRGGMEPGFPENSTEAFENVLKYDPAFFEVDPRLTKDSVVVLMHDATLDRTTNGKGRLADYTYAEIQQLRLKDKEGNLTHFKIPTLKEALLWSQGKTILNLDHKDVPLELTARILQQVGNDVVMLTVHSAAEAKFYLSNNKGWMVSAHILSQASLTSYLKAELPFKRIMAYIGSDLRPENMELLKRLHQLGSSCMISTVPSVDKLLAKERAAAYRGIINAGADVIETDRPLELGLVMKAN